MNIIKPSDIDKSLGEVLQNQKDDFEVALKFNSMTKSIIGNALLLTIANYLARSNFPEISETTIELCSGLLMVAIIGGKRFKAEFDAIDSVDEYCKRRGKNREEFRDYDKPLGYTEDLLNKKIMQFDVNEKFTETKRAKNKM